MTELDPPEVKPPRAAGHAYRVESARMRASIRAGNRALRKLREECDLMEFRARQLRHTRPWGALLGGSTVVIIAHAVAWLVR
jgi:hypothetical protein